MHRLQSQRNMRARVVLMLAVLTVVLVMACGSGLPELRPGPFDRPTATSKHGRITEKSYRRSNGPQTIYYKILEVDGKAVRIENGFAEFTSYCDSPGIDAVAFTVRGKPGTAGVWILQLDGTRQIRERLCDYGPLGRWEGTLFKGCGVEWDATKRSRAG